MGESILQCIIHILKSTIITFIIIYIYDFITNKLDERYKSINVTAKDIRPKNNLRVKEKYSKMPYYGNDRMEEVRDAIRYTMDDVTTEQLLKIFVDILDERIENEETKICPHCGKEIK